MSPPLSPPASSTRPGALLPRPWDGVRHSPATRRAEPSAWFHAAGAPRAPSPLRAFGRVSKGRGLINSFGHLQTFNKTPRAGGLPTSLVKEPGHGLTVFPTGARSFGRSKKERKQQAALFEVPRLATRQNSTLLTMPHPPSTRRATSSDFEDPERVRFFRHRWVGSPCRLDAGSI